MIVVCLQIVNALLLMTSLKVAVIIVIGVVGLNVVRIMMQGVVVIYLNAVFLDMK